MGSKTKKRHMELERLRARKLRAQGYIIDWNRWPLGKPTHRVFVRLPLFSATWFSLSDYQVDPRL